MNKRKILALSIALFAAGTTAAYAVSTDPISFDADGTLGDGTGGTTIGGDAGGNGFETVGGFDWLPGSSILLAPGPTSVKTSDFTDNGGVGDTLVTVFDPVVSQLYTHGALGSLTDTNGDGIEDPDGLKGSFEITYNAALEETVNTSLTSTRTSLGANGVVGGGDDEWSVESTASLTLATGGTGENFYQIFYDNLTGANPDGGTKSNSLLGTGYNDSTLILEGDVVFSDGNFDAKELVEFVDANDNGRYDPGEIILTSYGLLDQRINDDWAGVESVLGQGSTKLTVDVTFQKEDFFKDPLVQLVSELFFDSQNNSPFNQTNPSMSFDEKDGTDVPFDVGSINGFTGPDTLLQTDASNSFAASVPEPGSLVLLGLGLLGLGAHKQRKT